MDADHLAPRKLLLSSPGQQAEQRSQERADSAAAQSRHSFDHELDKNVSDARLEDHQKRLKRLKKELDYIAETDWKYDNVKPF